MLSHLFLFFFFLSNNMYFFFFFKPASYKGTVKHLWNNCRSSEMYIYKLMYFLRQRKYKALHFILLNDLNLFFSNGTSYIQIPWTNEVLAECGRPNCTNCTDEELIASYVANKFKEWHLTACRHFYVQLTQYHMTVIKYSFSY